MDSSRRAVESYWRSRLIDVVTSDEDKIAPVYKLEEICELLRTSHAVVVREVSEFIFKRMDHRSPIVKQKALRLIKYAVGKSGVEFRREMQRNSVVIRQLLHYKGQLDPLKADALNKAVRDTAQEAMSAIFSTEDNTKTLPSENHLAKRIQGFGNSNFEMQSDDKKSFLSEVVGIGSASLKQGLNSFAQAHAPRNNTNGSYKGPNLRSSLTTEIDYPDGYEGVSHPNDSQNNFGVSKNASAGTWVQQEPRLSTTESSNVYSSSTHTDSKTREERLLETLVTSGGVRLQPTRDAIQTFLIAAAKLNALHLCHAIETKLRSHLWQVRMKAICVLESILRKKDEENFMIVASYFCENKDVVLNCSESPQASVREKAKKVLGLLDGGKSSSAPLPPEKPVEAEMPNLIDTTDSDNSRGNPNSAIEQMEQTILTAVTSPPLMDDLFGDNNTEQKSDDDPFADVSFHSSGSTQPPTDDPFGSNNNGADIVDIFAPGPNNVSDIMSNLAIGEGNAEKNGGAAGAFPETIFSDSNVQSGIVAPQRVGSIPQNVMFPTAFNPASLSLPMNYGAMENLFAQQQLLATMHSFQQLGNFGSQGMGIGGAGIGGSSFAVPGIFNPNAPTQGAVNSVRSSPKKEETKAFDFISDHLAAARDRNKIV